jgi:hypothetical protein
MTDRDFDITWNIEADNLLRRRGNYMRDLIRTEFERNPRKDALLFDRNCYVTPVADDRYSVVWRFNPLRRIAEVSAVVPTHFGPGEDKRSLKERITSIVFQETGGKVNLAR